MRNKSSGFCTKRYWKAKADSGTWSILVESLGKRILDSACTKTVSGEERMNEYIENLNKKDKKEVVCSETESKSLFRFGDGVESKSIRTVNIPIVTGSKRTLLEVDVDVVKNNIPLLISKGTMSKLEVNKDFTRHEAEVHGQVFKSQSNSSGHYCVP